MSRDFNGGDRRGGGGRFGGGGGGRRGGGGHRGGGRGGFRRGGGGGYRRDNDGYQPRGGDRYEGRGAPRAVNFTAMTEIAPFGESRKDLIILTPTIYVRYRSYASLMTSNTSQEGYTLVITEQTTEADTIGTALGKFGISAYALRAERTGTGKPSTAIRAKVIVGTASGILGALDRGGFDADDVHTVIVDQHKAGLRQGELEELLHLLPELSGIQVAVGVDAISEEYTQFISSFMKEPQTADLTTLTEEQFTTADAAAKTQGSEVVEAGNGDDAPRGEESFEPTGPQAEAATGEGLEHAYLDLPAELLAKPNAVCDYIEGNPTLKVIMFCNTPSDADLTEALLRKRGISARKLVGFVHPGRIRGASDDFTKGLARVLVVTDVAAKRICLPADLVVNYSLGEEPESYKTRLASAHKETLKKVVSLVTPLEIANFHFLKKTVTFDFVQTALPSQADLLASKFEALKADAVTRNVAADPRWQTLSSLILKDEKKDEILALLLSNSIEVLPQALASQNGRRRSDDDRRSDNYEGNGEERRSRRDDYNQDEGSDRSRDEGQSDEPPREYLPPIKEARLYIGQGSAHELSAEGLSEILATSCELPKDQVKHLSVRKFYSFVDVPFERSEEIEAKLSTHTLSTGERLFVRQATIVTTPREGSAPVAPGTESQETQADGQAQAEGQEEAQAV
jgi:superfamily II DNA/RNA helicase